MTDKPAGWLDLEPHLHDAASAAKALRFLIEEALDSEHPIHPGQNLRDYRSLLVGCDLVDAISYAITQLSIHTSLAVETFVDLTEGKHRTGQRNRQAANTEGLEATHEQ